jgi:hypothetical protein
MNRNNQIFTAEENHVSMTTNILQRERILEEATPVAGTIKNLMQ